MISVSGFSGLIHSTPQINEPSHFLSAQLTEASLGQKRAVVESGRASNPINRGVEGFLGGFVDRVV